MQASNTQTTNDTIFSQLPVDIKERVSMHYALMIKEEDAYIQIKKDKLIVIKELEQKMALVRYYIDKYS